MYNAEKHSLQNLFTAEANDVMFEGFNKNLITFRDLGLPNQKFHYDWETKTWRNDKTGNAFDIKLDKFAID